MQTLNRFCSVLIGLFPPDFHRFNRFILKSAIVQENPNYSYTK